MEKRLKNILCKPMNSDPHRNLPCHTAFLFFHQKSCLLKRRGHLLQYCTVIQSVCTNCYGFSRVNVCRYCFYLLFYPLLLARQVPYTAVSLIESPVLRIFLLNELSTSFGYNSLEFIKSQMAMGQV